MFDRIRIARLAAAASLVAWSAPAAAAARAPGIFRGAPALEAAESGSLDPAWEALSVASADFDSDGIPDAAAGFAAAGGGVLRIFRGEAGAIYGASDETMRTAPFSATAAEAALAFPDRPDFLAAGDFDGDGDADLVAGSRGGRALFLWSGDGKGTFRGPRTIALPGPMTAAAAGEFGRADGLPDLAVAVGGDPRLLLFHGPAGALASAPEIVALPSEAAAVAGGDLDEDGYGDAAVATTSSLLTVSGRPLGAAPRLTEERAPLEAETSAISVGPSRDPGRPRVRLAGPADAACPAALLAAESVGASPRDLAGLDPVAAIALRVGPHAARGLLVLGASGTLSVLAPAAGATIVVNTTDTADARDGVLSLAEAVRIANGTLDVAALTAAEKAQVSGTPANPGLDAIHFAIPGSGVPVIAGAPPTITDVVTIDGTTQPGGLVEISPPSSSSATILSIKGGSSLVRGLVINGHGNAGIVLDSSDNVVEGNVIGLDAAGTAAVGPLGVAGVRVSSGTGNLIGGTTAAARNVISGVQGPGVNLSGGSGIMVRGNFIGTNLAGTAAVANQSEGIYVFGSTGATIGGTAAGTGNLVSGNGNAGIRIDTTGHVVQGNRIGTDVTGALAIGNGTAGLISYFNAGPNTIGGTAAGAGNLVSGNAGDGIQLANNAAADLVVQGNRVGTNAAGTGAVPNTAHGIHLVGISQTTIGGSGTGEGNLVSGNGGHGLFFDRFVNIMSTENVVHGNLVGTDVTGTTAIPNLGNGIHLPYSEGNRIGGAGSGEANVVSGNAENGIWIERLAPAGHPDVIQGNLIGTNVFGNAPLGNAKAGVVFSANSSGHTLGGAAAGEVNTIAYNKGAGVVATYNYGLHLEPNRIFGNGGLGLDRLADGVVTANVPGGYDNFPVLTSAVRSGSGTTIGGTLSAAAGSSYAIHFYASPACDPSGYGEGRVYLGSTNVTTNASGSASFSKVVTPAVPGGQFVTAYSVFTPGVYAPEASEFSQCRLVEGDPAPPSSVPLSVAVVVPSAGGNTAYVTVRISGDGIRVGATAKLVRSGHTDVGAIRADVAPDGGSLLATFPLAGEAAGLCDVVVKNPGGATATLPDAFQIEEGVGPIPWTQIIGPSKIVKGYPWTFHLIVGNRGDVDAHGVVVWLSGIPSEAQVQILTPLATPPQFPGNPVDLSAFPQIVQTGAGQEIPLFLPLIPPGAERVFSFSLKMPGAGNIPLRAALMTPMFGSPMKGTWAGCFYQIAQIASNFVPGLDCALAALGVVAETGSLLGSEESDALWSFAQALGEAILQCAEGIPVLKAYKAALEVINLLINGTELFSDCNPLVQRYVFHNTTVVLSFDPNDKMGPDGAGPGRAILPDEPLDYEITFENKPAATAPAREVTVEDDLDTSVYDLSTFQFRPFRIADRRSGDPAPGADAFTMDLDLRPARDVIARVSGEIDRPSGHVVWRFTSLDPDSGEPVTDALGGFLPPDAAPPEGRGSVRFQVKLKEGLPTGTAVSNHAAIVFDANDPILTPVWTNTVDRDAPSSHVLAPALACARMAIAWTGTDAGGGIASFDIYRSEDGGPFTPWLTKTTATSAVFQGAPGKSYAFYSVARDLVGNVEGAPVAADVEFTVPSSGPSIASITPASGSAAGGIVVQISGSDFLPGATVTIGGTAATGVIVTPSQITATVPARPAGSLSDVAVTNPGGCAGVLEKGWLADFADVPPSHLFHGAIAKILRAGITTGCGGPNYCPSSPVTRDQMAVFILRAKHGGSFQAPPPLGTEFADVTVSTFLGKWIELFGTEGFTTGCGGGNYCPNNPVQRSEMAVFLVRARHGYDFAPAAATGAVFGDVTPSTLLARWIEQLKADGVT
ncbi:MAG TPA: FG-GAP-like repeat-containing protein, partial [Thermoanaerobaculia bacterium]